MTTQFLPLKKMFERLETSKQESDSAYFYDLLLLGEMMTKTIVSGIVAGIKDDKERNRYRQTHRIVRADGIGEWSAILDECLTGVASQFLTPSVRDSEQKELTQKTEVGQWQYDSVNLLFETMRIVNLSVPQVQSSKLQAKSWFQNFATLRNGTRAHGATLPITCSKAIAPLEKSLRLFVENFSFFKREWVYLYQNISGKYRITNLNESTSEFDILKLDNSYSSQFSNGVYVYFDEKTFIELMVSNPEADDYFYPNGNFKDKTYELLSYVTGKRIQGESFKYLTPASELPPSETEGLNSLYVVDNCFTNLPNTHSDYINRRDLEEQLLKVITEKDRYPIVTLKGLGGIGKTSLALSVLNQIAQTERYEFILWFSSRDIDLIAEGAKPVKNNILDKEDIAHEFVKLMSKIDIKTQEREKYLSQEMTKSSHGSILFVFDNFETVKNPVELFNWIDTYIRNPNKVLITSRTSKNFKADYPIEVSGMSETECRHLIEKTAANLAIRNLVTPKVIEDILHESNGHPYVIKIFLGEIAKNRKVLKIERVIATQEDILTALFRRTYSWLTPAAKRVFLTLCSWRSIIPQIALEAVLLREVNQRIDVENAVEELRMSSFIEVITSSGDEASFLSVPLAAASFGRAELEVSPEKFAILSDRELLMEFGAAQQAEISAGINSGIQRKFRSIASRIINKKESIEIHIPTLEFLASKYSPAWMYLAALYEENNDVSRAQSSLREFLKTDCEDSIKKQAWQRLADLYRKEKDWFGEINALVEKSSLPYATLLEISEVANTLNQYIQQNKLELDSDIKEMITKKLVDIFTKKIDRSVTATDCSRLAWLNLRLGRQSMAIELTQKGLLINNDNEYCNKLAEKLGIKDQE